MESKRKVGIVICIVLLIVIIGLYFLFGKRDVYYEVVFNYNNTTDVVQVLENDVVTKPANPEKEGYTFAGWYYNNEKFDFATKITENITLDARWVSNSVTKFVVTFDADGGSNVDSIEVLDGNSIDVLPIPEKDGYKFVGWYNEDNYFDSTSVVTSDITLTARWEKIEETVKEEDNSGKVEVKKYTVKFNSNGGTTVSSQTVTEGNKVSKPTNPTRNGYTFAGWTLNGSVYDFNTIVTKNITLVAKWTENVKAKYTVTFDSQGGTTVSSQTVTEGNKVSKPTNPTRSGYTFAGWTLNGSAYDFNTIVTKNITLVAKWTENVKAKYTVTFDSQGGTTVSSQTVTEGSKVSKPTNPTRNGYLFESWILDGVVYNFDKSVTKSITLKATWYSTSWGKIEDSSIGQYYLYIVSSNGTRVSGTVKITTKANKTSTMTVPVDGVMLVKEAISDVSIVNVD